MPDDILNAVTSLRQEAAAYPSGVLIWMKIMAGSFFSGVVIAYWDRRALWIVAMAALTALLLVALRLGLPALSRGQSGAIIHLVIWPLALLLVWRPAAGGRAVYRWWRYWVSCVIAVSLVLDLRALIGWP